MPKLDSLKERLPAAFLSEILVVIEDTDSSLTARSVLLVQKKNGRRLTAKVHTTPNCTNNRAVGWNLLFCLKIARRQHGCDNWADVVRRSRLVTSAIDRVKCKHSPVNTDDGGSG